MVDGFSAEEKDGITIVRFHRRFEIAEILEVMERVARQFDSDRRLWVVGQYFDFTPGEINRIAARGRSTWSSDSRVAFVTKDDLAFGLLRVLEVYREQVNYNTQVFRDEELALGWLKESSL